ncbi:hypothetical protein D3C72_1844100 [compost metagenome]
MLGAETTGEAAGVAVGVAGVAGLAFCAPAKAGSMAAAPRMSARDRVRIRYMAIPLAMC